MKTYNTADVELILEWADRYFEVNALVNEVLGYDNLEYFPPFPSFENEIEYQRLRFWFRKNHDKFVPIWADFCLSKGISMGFNCNIDEVEYRKNPFLYFYSPDNLLDLAYTMGATITSDTWEPNKQAVMLVLNIINSFSNTVIHLKYWIGEFADTRVL